MNVDIHDADQTATRSSTHEQAFSFMANEQWLGVVKALQQVTCTKGAGKVPEWRTLAGRQPRRKVSNLLAAKELSIAAVADSPAVRFLLILYRWAVPMAENVMSAFVRVEEELQLRRQLVKAVGVHDYEWISVNDPGAPNVVQFFDLNRPDDLAAEIPAAHRDAADCRQVLKLEF